MALPKGAGELGDRVVFLRSTGVKDGMGGKTTSEAKQATTWARVLVLQAKDNVIADQTRDIRTHEVALRDGAFLAKQGDIVLWKGARLVVRATHPIAPWLLLDCTTETK